MEGTFVGVFLIGTNRGRSSRRLSNIGSAATLNISPFRVKRGNSTLCSSLPLFLSPLLLLRDPLCRVYRLPSIAFYSLLRKNSARDNGSDTSLLPSRPRRLLFFPRRIRSSSSDCREKGRAGSRRKDLVIPTDLIPHRSRKFRLIHTRLAIFP